MKRRDFLKGSGCFVVTASVGGLAGCASSEDGGTFAFPQGVASGDPRSSSVMLWTRVVRKSGDDADITLTLEVSERTSFDTLVATRELTATPASDFTVRVLVEELDPATTYHYRFLAGSDESRVGRTRTAPKAGADVPVRFAWASCQDYSVNFYGAYRQLINDDKAADSGDEIQFVLHVGDFIYETRAASYEMAITDDLEHVMLENADGSPRVVPEFPKQGGMTEDGVNYALHVDDYRHLYKTYLTDPDLQEARARWPFICVWDDHEFTNDCWQTQANYSDEGTTDEPSQKRRVAASQAWFEYIPAALDDAEETSGVTPDAQDFRPVKVEDAPYDAVVDVAEKNSQQALGAITIYRNLRWGKHVELVVTDSRSYRSDHALAEEVTKNDLLVFHPRVGLPKDAVNIADAGREANGGKPPDKALNFENTRKDSPPGTLLGAAQKAWWKQVMKASDATFKVWGNPVPLLRLLLDTSDVDLLANDLLLAPDAWDGYNTERKELMRYLLDENILNVISLSGDHHANYAGVILDDFDAADGKPVMVDIATAGLASNSQFHEVGGSFDAAVPDNLREFVEPIKRTFMYDSTKLGGTDKAVVNLNTLIRYGSKAANVAADTHDLKKIEAARDPKVNAHLRYADARANGYGLVRVDGQGVAATLVTIERSFKALGEESPGIRGTATFTVPRAETFDEVALSEPALTGKKPFPLE
jgi:alkaline phosphatase D